MNTNIWKQKSLTPALLNESDASYRTVIELQNAINDSDILNIAVTGPYGSGKSSVLRTFQAKADPGTKILDISLATLDADESLDSLYAEEKKAKTETKYNNENKSLHEQQELLNRKIEYSILQQLVYRKSLEALPYSRMKKIRHYSKSTIKTITLYTIGIVLCIAFSYRLPLLQVPLLFESMNIPVGIQNAISIIAVIFLLIMIYEILNYFYKFLAGIRPQKISLKGNEIDVCDEGSIFNRYLEEILYFFQCTDYNVVIIEDLDRFNTTEIFLKLRELNHLINKSEMVGRTVKFIYAIKDDMFKDASRTKFFDYITTVIPVITTSNSKDKLKQALKEIGHDGEIPDEDIRDIAFYINDMRLLNNIVNEYDQYSNRLSHLEHPLDARKMLAMMTIKNYHPHDFSELHNRKGKLYNALSQDAKRTYVSFAISSYLSKREAATQNKLKAYDETCHLSTKELRLIYLITLNSKAEQFLIDYIIDGQYYTISQIAENDILFEKVRNEHVVSYRYYDRSYGRNREDKIRYNFPEIEKEVNPEFPYSLRVSQIDIGRESIIEELQDIKHEKERLSAYKIHELIEKFEIYKEDFFKKFELSALEEDFIRRGFISEDYNDYITYFYSGIMSLADHQLCLDIKLNRKNDYETSIDNVEQLLKELPTSSLRYESIWNYHILDFLSEHKVEWENYYDLFVDSLIDMDSSHFLYCYYVNKDRNLMVFSDCMKRGSSKMWEKISNADNNESAVLYRLWFITCKVSDINDIQSQWINSNYTFLENIYSELSKEKQELLTQKSCYESLSTSNSVMLIDVIKNGCYKLNDHNIPIIVLMKNAKTNITKLSNIEEMQYALNSDLLSESWYNVNEYYKKCDNTVDDTLIQYLQRHIQFMSCDSTCHDEKYSNLFQSLLEQSGFNDESYSYLCIANNFSIDFTPTISVLPQTKIMMLIETHSLIYSIDILSSLNKLSNTLCCAYIIENKEKLDEMLQTDIMSSSLADCILRDGRFSQVECQKTIASLASSKNTLNQSLADKICEIMAIQSTPCENDILYNAIRMCSIESHAVMAAVRKINASGMNSTIINDVLSYLPKKYNELKELYKRPKYEENTYNKALIETLKIAGYISSFKIEDGMIKVITKHK